MPIAALRTAAPLLWSIPIGAAYSQAEVQVLRDRCEELADDVRAEAALVNALRTALVSTGLMKGGP
jgi:hypothetical protein